VPPFQTLYKLSGAYTFPYDLNLSVTFQARPGIGVGSFYTFNSAIAGVALTGGGNLTVSVVDPTTQYYDYVKTLDARIARTFRYGRMRMEPFASARTGTSARFGRDRKSTRLNSSHVAISYAVFCLKKKKKETQETKTNN